MTVKTVQAPNLARSAIAPEIRATVMIAKTTWKATKAAAGIPPAAAAPCGVRRDVPDDLREDPAQPELVEGVTDEPLPPTSAPNASLYPHRIQAVPTVPIAMNDIIIMLRTLLVRTMPP